MKYKRVGENKYRKTACIATIVLSCAMVVLIAAFIVLAGFILTLG